MTAGFAANSSARKRNQEATATPTTTLDAATVTAVLAEHRDDMESGDYGEILWSGCTCGHEHPFAEHDLHVAATLLAAPPIAQALAAVDVLAELVALKDGPRGEEYEDRKPLAWAAARRTLRAALRPGDPK